MKQDDVQREIDRLKKGFLHIGLAESKYKFSRAKWHQAYFDSRNYYKIDRWCEQQFGPHPKRPDAWSRWWHKYENSILFRDEKDYVLFMLRWGV